MLSVEGLPSSQSVSKSPRAELITVIDCLLNIVELLTDPSLRSRHEVIEKRVRENAKIAKKAFEAYKKKEWGA